MIKLTVELQDISDNYNLITTTLPSNIEYVLDKDHEYIIVDCTPNIRLPYRDDVFKLNEVLQSINNNNSAINANLLSMLIDASNNNDLFNELFIDRLIEDNFYFKEVLYLDDSDSIEIKTAKFLFKHQNIPPAQNLIIEPVTIDEWKFIWKSYANMGFKILNGKDYDYEGVFVTYW